MNDTVTNQDEEELFCTLYEQQYLPLLRYVSSRLKCRDGKLYINDRADDVVQEIFCFAWTRRHELFQSQKPIGWLFNVSYYKILEFLNAERRWSRHLLDSELQCLYWSEPPFSPYLEFDGIITEEELDLLKRIYLYGYTYNEVSTQMGTTKTALAVRIHRIKEKIRKETLK